MKENPKGDETKKDNKKKDKDETTPTQERSVEGEDPGDDTGS